MLDYKGTILLEYLVDRMLWFHGKVPAGLFDLHGGEVVDGVAISDPWLDLVLFGLVVKYSPFPENMKSKKKNQPYERMHQGAWMIPGSFTLLWKDRHDGEVEPWTQSIVGCVQASTFPRKTTWHQLFCREANDAKKLPTRKTKLHTDFRSLPALDLLLFV